MPMHRYSSAAYVSRGVPRLYETGKYVEDSGVHLQDLTKCVTLFRLRDRLASSANDIRQQWHNPEGTRTRHFLVVEILPPELFVWRFSTPIPKDADGFVKLNSFRERKKDLRRGGEIRFHSKCDYLFISE
jgi:hypothetical protein